ncbi:MAG: fumarate hydratase [Ruthenibacterium sp.]
MRTITAAAVTQAVKALCVQANTVLPPDMTAALRTAYDTEPWPIAKQTLGTLCQNLDAAAATGLPICQDTGMACVFAEVGQDVHIEGDFEAAVNEGVRRGYTEGYLRKSVVEDPLRRTNTGDNTPAVITTRLVSGDTIKLTLAPKGFGSENMSRLAMQKPSDGAQGVMDFVVETVRLAGPNPCPPIVVGVGIGGTFDRVALLAKQALLRPVGSHHKDAYYAAMEDELLRRINALGTGPQGFGGRTTALGVQIETFATHIAGLPVAVNINCHVTRHKEVVL